MSGGHFVQLLSLELLKLSTVYLLNTSSEFLSGLEVILKCPNGSFNETILP